MTWEPQQEGLQQMIAILKQSQSPNTATQMAVQVVSTWDVVSLFHCVELLQSYLFFLSFILNRSIFTPVIR